MNLLTNAAKYTDRGGRIWMTAQKEGEEAVLRVRDTGVGIAPEVLPRISACYAGGPVPRSLARWIGHRTSFGPTPRGNARGNGGGFQCFGAGSEFVVRLPLVSPHQPQTSSPPTETAQPTYSSLRVLVVVTTSIP